MAPGYLPAAEVREDGGAVDAVLLRQLQDARTGLVVGDQVIDLGGGEKSLNRLDSPHDGAPMVSRGSILGPVGAPVDPTVQASDQRVGLRREVAKRATQAPHLTQVQTFDQRNHPWSGLNLASFHSHGSAWAQALETRRAW